MKSQHVKTISTFLVLGVILATICYFTLSINTTEEVEAVETEITEESVEAVTYEETSEVVTEEVPTDMPTLPEGDVIDGEAPPELPTEYTGETPPEPPTGTPPELPAGEEIAQ